MNDRTKRLTALEQAHPSSTPRLHCVRQYEDETPEQAIAVYEAENGPVCDGKGMMRVIISKPGSRFKQVPTSI